MNICICGGGSLGHVCAGVLASHPGVSVRIHSRQPERWADTLRIVDPAGKTYVGRLATVTADYARAVADCQMVFLCLPGYAIAPTLQALAPHLPAGCSVGAIVGSTVFFLHAHQLLPADTPLFAFQRTPFIARTDSYGQSALLLGYKPAVELAAERFPDAEAFRAQVEQLFVTPTRLLNNFYEASLTNSNPILHTGRLYTMWANWDGTPTTAAPCSTRNGPMPPPTASSAWTKSSCACSTIYPSIKVAYPRCSLITKATMPRRSPAK